MKYLVIMLSITCITQFSCTEDVDVPAGVGNRIQVTTNTISAITANSAISGGTIIAGGADSVTAKGVCWSTASNPTTGNSKTNNGTGPGAYTSVISGLSSNTFYYVRSYAVSSAGTFYGSLRSFRTN